MRSSEDRTCGPLFRLSVQDPALLDIDSNTSFTTLKGIAAKINASGVLSTAGTMLDLLKKYESIAASVHSDFAELTQTRKAYWLHGEEYCATEPFVNRKTMTMA
jgi:hypothetical protein